MDEITYEDHFKLFAATEGKTRTGVGSKEDIRKVLNNAYRKAMLGEFKHWSPPAFPQFSRQMKGHPSLTSDDWDRLIQKVIELSGGYAKQDLTPDAYKSLEWEGRNRLKGYRNWVDLYDALLLQWFFFHRAEDACRLVGEEYRVVEGDWRCYLGETKGDRAIYETHSYRSEHKGFMDRLEKRKPSRYLVFPQ